MKLYEFVDKLYEMGDIEYPKTLRSKTTLNESLMLEASSGEMLDRFFELNVGVDPEELLQWILQNVITDEQLREMVDYAEEIEHMHAQDDIEESLVEDDLDEGVLGGLAGAAIGGLAGNSLGHPVLGAIGGGLAGSAIQNALNDDDDLEEDLGGVVKGAIAGSALTGNSPVLGPIGAAAGAIAGGIGSEIKNTVSDWQAGNREKLAGALSEDKDLSTVQGSMTQILQDNREKIDACSSAQEVYDVVAGLLAEAGLDTTATRRLLLTLKKQKRLTGALQAVYNSILKGSDLGVIKEAANANPPRYQVKGCGKNGRVENHDQFMIFDSEYNDEIDYYDLCEIIRDVNEDNDLSSSQVEDIATDVISELYFKTPDEDLGEIISMYSY